MVPRRIPGAANLAVYLPFGLALFGSFALSACGRTKTAATVFEKTTEECLGDALESQFLVHYSDGHTEVVQAESKQAFLDGFVTQNLSLIEYAEYDFRVRVDRKPTIYDSVPTPSADNWGPIRVNADALWQQNVRGEGAVVAIVDSGMDIRHSQLQEQIFHNSGEIGTDTNGRDRAANGLDDDHNGFVDDAYGYDFVNNRGLRGDHQEHGTHVAGVIAAAHSDTHAQATSYIQGIAPDAKVLPLAFLGRDGTGLISDGVRAIKYAVQRGARVINASWGGSACSRSLRDLIATLDSRGVVFVAAAGNAGLNIDRQREFPASLDLPAQITVGAVGVLDFMAEYSNYGVKTVHLFAPGTDIVSTLPEGRIGALTGTSMATPFVTGAVALLLGAEPSASVAQIRHALAASAFKRSEYLNASQGRLDLRTALTILRDSLDPNRSR
ncbi:MAG: S8 family peptidase [Bdellovibrionales bacterium]